MNRDFHLDMDWSSTAKMITAEIIFLVVLPDMVIVLISHDSC